MLNLLHAVMAVLGLVASGLYIFNDKPVFGIVWAVIAALWAFTTGLRYGADI